MGSTSDDRDGTTPLAEAPTAVAATPPVYDGAPAPLRLEPGLVLGGRYVVDRCLGSGGMGTVYAARDRLVDQPVALKFIAPVMAQAPGERERLRHEVRLAQAVTHVNVVRTHTLEEADGHLFIVMELLGGETLGARLRRGAMAAAEAEGCFRRLLAGLAEAHAKGVVHRDIKPQNIMLCDGRRPVLMDFGLARTQDAPRGEAAAPAVGAATHTQTSLGGTPGYIAPEVLRGERGGPAADLYAMGAVLFEMLVGQQPFAAKTPLEMMQAHTERPAPDPASLRDGIPARLAAVALRLLAKTPGERFVSAEATLAALREEIEPGPPARAPRRRHRALAVGAVLVAAGAVALVASNRPAKEPRPMAPRPARVEPDPAAAHGAFAGHVLSWSTGLPVAGAELIFEAGAASRSVRTGPDGRFELVADAAEPHRLQAATARGFLPYAPSWGQSPVELQPRPGRRVVDLILYMVPAIDYQGLVEDPAGKPVPGAQVRLVGTRAGEQALLPIRDLFVTDGEGRFTFQAPDFAVLEARAAGQPPGSAVLDSAAQVTHRLVIRLGAGPAAGTQTITGQVVQPDGRPVAGALVRAHPVEVSGQLARPGAVQAETGGDGRFVLGEVAGGAEHVVVVSVGGQPRAYAAPVQPGAEVAVTLGGARVVRGQVRSGGAPVPAFTVEVQQVRGKLRRVALTARAVVDAEGRFELAGLPPGRYRLRVSAFGLAPGEGPEVELGADEPAEVSVELAAGGAVTGTAVAAEDGRPLPGARVRVAVDGNAAATIVPWAGSTITDAGGRFEVIGVPAGRRSLTAVAYNRHARVVSGIDVVDGGRVGPLRVALAPVAAGEAPGAALAGVGAQLVMTDDDLVVSGLLEGSGAAAAGLMAGDVVVAVDGREVTALGYGGAIDAIRGQEGTRVTMTIRRGAETFDRAVERRRIQAAWGPAR